MILVDTVLARRQQEGRPIRIGVIGAGFMARGIVLQVVLSVPGMRVAAVANRHLAAARLAYEQAGIDHAVSADSQAQLEQAIAQGRPAVTEDALALCRADGIDAIVEVTGTIEHAARVTLEAIAHGKHVVLMNAELDGTLGPILKPTPSAPASF